MLETRLFEIEKDIKEVITSGLTMIKTDPSVENEILKIFLSAATRVNDYFIIETERTNTESVAKKTIKYAMFKRF